MQTQKNCSEVFIYKKSLLFNISLDSSILEVILKFGNVLVIPALQIEKLIHIFLQNWYEVSVQMMIDQYQEESHGMIVTMMCYSMVHAASLKTENVF